MNIEQVVQKVQQDITAIQTKQNNDHVRIEENKNLAAQFHELNSNLKIQCAKIEHLTNQLEGQKSSLDKLIGKYDTKLTGQGERVGSIERAYETLSVTLNKLQECVNNLETDVENLKSKGSKRWDSIIDGIIGKIIYVVVGATLMFFLYQFGL